MPIPEEYGKLIIRKVRKCNKGDVFDDERFYCNDWNFALPYLLDEYVESHDCSDEHKEKMIAEWVPRLGE